MKNDDLNLHRIERLLKTSRNEHSTHADNPVYLWLNWLNKDYKDGSNTMVCASNHPPADFDIAETNDGVVSVPLNVLILDGVQYLLSDFLNKNGKLRLNEAELSDFNRTLDNIAGDLETTINCIRDLKL